MHRSVDTLVRLHEKGKLLNEDVEGTEYRYTIKKVTYPEEV